jgi:mono/diheme cytochrome c family protein
VTNGKSQMPAWGDLLKGDDIEALWAYVTIGEKK